MQQRNRVYTEPILRNEDHLRHLEQYGFFITKTLEELSLNDIRNSYSRYVAMSGSGKGDNFKPSVNDSNLDAIDYSKKEIDRIIGSAFEKVFFRDKVDYCGGVFLVKQSGAHTHHKLHQDRALIDERKTFALYSWTPITQMAENTGRLFVIPGSHKWGHHQRSLEINLPNLNEQELLPLAIALDVQAGETIFFDTALMHGSHPNTSGEERVAVNFFVKPKNYPEIHFALNEQDNSLLDIYEINPDFFFKQHFLSNNFRAKYSLLASEKKLF